MQPPLPQDLLAALPPDVSPDAVTARALVRAAPDSFMGETYLLVHRGRLLVYTRSSLFEPWAPLDLAPGEAPVLQRGDWNAALLLRTRDGATRKLALGGLDRDAANALLATLAPGGGATPATPAAPESRPAPAARTSPPVDAAPAGQIATPEQHAGDEDGEDDQDDDDEVPAELLQAEEEIVDAIVAARLADAAARLRALPPGDPQLSRMVPTLLDALDALERDAPEEACALLMAWGIERSYSDVVDALFLAVAPRLEARGEFSMAFVAWREVDDERGRLRARAIAEQLGADDRRISRDATARALELLRPRAARSRDGDLLVGMSELAYEDCQYDEAEALAARALEIDPAELRAALARAEALEELGRADELVACLEQALAHHAESAEVLALALRHARADPRRALELAERALALAPDDVRAQYAERETRSWAAQHARSGGRAAAREPASRALATTSSREVASPNQGGYGVAVVLGVLVAVAVAVWMMGR